MGSFKLGKISMGGLFRKPYTKMYPVVVPEYYERTAGHIENQDMKGCILCSMCAKKCPTSAIAVDKEAETWSIDRFNCIGCGSCVRVCPKNCLFMLRTYTPAATEKSVEVLHKPELTPEEKAAKAKADAEKAERIKAAREAAAAKKAKADAEGGAPEGDSAE